MIPKGAVYHTKKSNTWFATTMDAERYQRMLDRGDKVPHPEIWVKQKS